MSFLSVLPWSLYNSHFHHAVFAVFSEFWVPNRAEGLRASCGVYLPMGAVFPPALGFLSPSVHRRDFWASLGRPNLGCCSQASPQWQLRAEQQVLGQQCDEKPECVFSQHQPKDRDFPPSPTLDQRFYFLMAVVNS